MGAIRDVRIRPMAFTVLVAIQVKAVAEVGFEPANVLINTTYCLTIQPN